jgi:hypothetical protein
VFNSGALRCATFFLSAENPEGALAPENRALAVSTDFKCRLTDEAAKEKRSVTNYVEIV